MRTNFTKILMISLYLIFMLVSTWATAESVTRLLNLNKIIVWVVAVGFFVGASIGGKLLVESLDYDNFYHNRLRSMLIGISLIIICWILVILPTNTHTFFYKNNVRKICLTELKDTESKLLQIKNDGKTVIEREKDDLKKKVEAEIASMKYEIQNYGNPGHGPRTDSIINRLEVLLGQPIHRLQPKNTSRTGLVEHAQQMDSYLRNLLESRLNLFNDRLAQFESQQDNKEFNTLIADLKDARNKLGEEPTEEIRTTLINSFALINKYSDMLKQTFKDKTFLHMDNDPETIALENVYYTWRSFFAGKYGAQGFWFWIMVAALIDILGFVFFIFGFKKD